jgi:hypothetical protein
MNVRSAVLPTLILLVLASPAAALSGRQLLQQCDALMRGASVTGDQVTLPRDRAAAECWVYMAAIQDLSATVERENGPSLLGSCVPPSARRMEIVAAFVKYARSHPDELGLRATAIVIPALMEAFPCGPEANQ